jgi:energy-coupling factor transport system permease protein
VSTLLREVPRDTPVHRLWAGTKLLAVAALAVALSLQTSWAAIGVVTALLVFTALLARVPVGALPRPRPWFWALIVGAGLLSVPAGGAPELQFGGVTIGLGAVMLYVRFTALAAVSLIAGLLLGDQPPRWGTWRRLWPDWAGHCGGCGHRCTSGR